MKKEAELNINSIYLKFSWKSKKVYEKMFYSVIEELQLTQNEIDVLLFLINNKLLDTSKDIVEYRAISKSMVSKSVDSLFKKGYISYETDKTDKRCIHLKINPIAIPIARKLQEVQRKFFDVLCRGISVEEYGLIEGVLSKMYQNITEELEK